MPARIIARSYRILYKEIDRGIEGTGVKAGVITIEIISKNPTALEEAGLRVAARASKATGIKAERPGFAVSVRFRPCCK